MTISKTTDLPERILTAIGTGKLTAGDIAKSTGIKKRSVQYWTSRMRKAGLIKALKDMLTDGRKVYFTKVG